MMFSRISRRIALQFTVFVFLLLMVNGAIFLLADFGNARRMAQGELVRSARMALREADNVLQGSDAFFPPPLRDRIRIIDPQGRAMMSGAFFTNVPFVAEEGYSTTTIDNEDVRIYTTKVLRGDRVAGFVQVAGIDRLRARDLPVRAFMFLLVSLLISGLTYAVGLFFANRSLQPAAEMMVRLEQFTQDASHELRTPLASLQSSLDLALKSKRYREGILSAKEDLRGVAVLIERLLELARLDRLELTSTVVDLSALVQKILERSMPLTKEKRVMIKSDIEPGVKVEGDGALIGQLVSNLLQNAIKFSKPDGGTIAVKLTPQMLSIRDTGVGISRKDLPHVFDRFYQADASRSRGGYGLGLALVSRIADLHGWDVRAESTIGKGSTFTVTFTGKS